jgi:ATP-dependent Clp protease protease subunit
MKRTKEKLHNLYVERTGRSLEEIKAAMDRDNWLTPQEAVDFGLIDAIQYKR